MITVGIDLAAEPKNTGMAVLEWTATTCRVVTLSVGVDDETILATSLGADKVGIDCPIGWPDAFVEFVVAHRDGHVTVPAGVPGNQWRRPLANRLTDDVVHRDFGVVPLSVSADRIARPAMRAAGLLASLAAGGPQLDRTGAGLIVEVYPAASLKQWGLRHRSYKGALGSQALGELAGQLLDQAGWLDAGDRLGLLCESDHAFDAVIAALTARAAALGLTQRPDAAQAAIARREGWIAVPINDDVTALRPGVTLSQR